MADVSVHYEIMVKIQAAIVALNLTGLRHEPIIQEALNIVPEEIPPPLVLIAPYGTEELSDYTNLRDVVSYPTAVAIVIDKDDKITTLSQRLFWRQSIRRIMNNENLDVDENFTLKVKPANIVDLQAYRSSQKWVSGIVVMAQCGELRTK